MMYVRPFLINESVDLPPNAMSFMSEYMGKTSRYVSNDPYKSEHRWYKPDAEYPNYYNNKDRRAGHVCLDLSYKVIKPILEGEEDEKTLFTEPIPCIFINLIQVGKLDRQQGLGKAAMQEIIRMADVHGVNLGLQPMNMGDNSMTTKELGKWYNKFGFEWIDLEDLDMVRFVK